MHRPRSSAEAAIGSSSLTGATVTGPAGSPPAVSIDLGATNPADGDAVSFTFNLPDGTTETVQLTASSAVPTPAGSFAIGATPAATAANLNAALTSSIGTLAKTSLVGGLRRSARRMISLISRRSASTSRRPRRLRPPPPR